MNEKYLQPLQLGVVVDAEVLAVGLLSNGVSMTSHSLKSCLGRKQALEALAETVHDTKGGGALL